MIITPTMAIIHTLFIIPAMEMTLTMAITPMVIGPTTILPTMAITPMVIGPTTILPTMAITPMVIGPTTILPTMAITPIIMILIGASTLFIRTTTHGGPLTNVTTISAFCLTYSTIARMMILSATAMMGIWT